MAGRRGHNGRQRLVDAAFELFATQGFDHTTSREIAARAGVSLGLIHKHFGTLDALVRATDQRVLDWTTRRIEKWLPLFAGPDQPARTIEDDLALAYVTKAIIGQRSGVQNLYFAVLDASRRVFQLMQREGKLRADVPVDACAQFLLLLELGALAAVPLHAATDSGRKAEPFLRAEVMALAYDALSTKGPAPAQATVRRRP